MARSMARSGESSCRMKPASVDRAILVAHLARQRDQIGFVRVVIRVEHRGRDDAGRGRGQEAVRESGHGLRRRSSDVRSRASIGAKCRDSAVRSALRERSACRLRFGKAPLQILDEFGKLLVVAPAPPFRFAGETRHALRHVGLEADALLFAVIADIDAGLHLLFDHMSARRGPFRDPAALCRWRRLPRG